MEDNASSKPGVKGSNGRIKRTAEWWNNQKEQTGRRTSGRLVQQAKTTTATTTTYTQEKPKVQLQIRQGNKPTVLHIVKTKLPPGAKRLSNTSKDTSINQGNDTKGKAKAPHVNGKTVNHKSPVTNHIKSNFQLLISNLALDVTKEQLEEHFRKTGGVKSIQIPKEKGQDTGKGIAYIDFKSRISHGIALRLHHTTMGGKQISVQFSPNIISKSKKRKSK
ncbi:hypothetical protein SNE40_009869 [Patella caerulea]|uniref:RRM domain-containing protein n=1 Tax=Patella caerulea TaxID=87958 RepID=A0AAN8PZ46_PATCE